MVDFDSSEGKHPASPQSGFLVVRLAGDLHQLIAGLQHLHSRRVLHSDIKARLGWWLWRKDFVAKQLKWYVIHMGSWWFLFTAFFFSSCWLMVFFIEGVSCYLATWRLLLRVSQVLFMNPGVDISPVLTWYWGFFPLFKAFPPTVWGSSRPLCVYAPPEQKCIFYGYPIPVTFWLNEDVSWWEIS